MSKLKLRPREEEDTSILAFAISSMKDKSWHEGPGSEGENRRGKKQSVPGAGEKLLRQRRLEKGDSSPFSYGWSEKASKLRVSTT